MFLRRNRGLRGEGLFIALGLGALLGFERAGERDRGGLKRERKWVVYGLMRNGSLSGLSL